MFVNSYFCSGVRLTWVTLNRKKLLGKRHLLLLDSTRVGGNSREPAA
jgi:hypothetical protein